MTELTNDVKNQVLDAQSKQMRLIRESAKKCRCAAIERRVRRNGIRTIMALQQCSAAKAEEAYDNTIYEGFDACCALCCTCHIERHVDNNRGL